MNAVILPGNDAGEDFYFNSKEKMSMQRESKRPILRRFTETDLLMLARYFPCQFL